jgi:regulator of sigma E protease
VNNLLPAATDIGFSLLAFILMISIIVTVHEYGHYRSARWFGLIGTHFSVGFGRKLFGWTDKHGTEWRIAPILLGGYVKFPGDDETERKPGQKTLDSLPRWQRAIVVAAGPGINLIFAALIFAFIAFAYGYPAGRPVVTSVVAGSPAAIAGLEVGDEITRFAGDKIILAADVTQRVMLHPGKQVRIELLRDEVPLTKTVRLASQAYDDGLGNKAQLGFLGIGLPREHERSPTVIAALTKGVSDGIFMGYTQITSLKQIFSGERRLTEMSGPVRIAKMSSHTLSMGVMPFLYMMAMLSIAVGLMNLLPIPGMDGGHLATYALEGAMRRDIPVPLAKAMLKVGIVMIVCLGILGLTLDFVALA